MRDGAPASLNRAAQLVRFAGVGGLGFLIDASLLTLIVATTELGPYWGRAVSFAAAVSVTWYANRRLVFTPGHYAGTEYVLYIAFQSIGAAINLTVYVIVLRLDPELGRQPVIPLAIGAAIALLFNFFASERFVFGRAAADSRPQADASGYSGRRNLEVMEGARNYNRYLLGLVLGQPVSGKALDFGAGSGTFARQLALAGLDLICVEPDPSLRAELTASGLHSVAEISDVPLASLDFIYSFNVLEHIEDDADALFQLGRRLRPGGRLLIYVPAFQILYSAMDRKVGHFRRYRKNDLVAKLRAAGFRVDAARYADCLGFFATLLYRLVGNASGEISPRSIALYDSMVFPLSRLGDHACGWLFGKNLVVVSTYIGD